MRNWTVLFASLLLAGCPGSLPKSDSTNPTLTWTVVNLNTQESQTFETSGKVSAHVGDEFRITATARDNEGVHKLAWQAFTTFTCSQEGATSQVNGDGVSFNAKDEFAPNADNKVLTVVPFIRNVTITGTQCPAGTTFDGGNTAVLAQTENFFGGETKGVLNIGIGG